MEINKCTDCDCEDDDRDLFDEPLRAKPNAIYKRKLRIEGCTCGNAKIVTVWAKEENGDLCGVEMVSADE